MTTVEIAAHLGVSKVPIDRDDATACHGCGARAVFWNPLNGVVCCHSCGTTDDGLTGLKMRELMDEVERLRGQLESGRTEMRAVLAYRDEAHRMIVEIRRQFDGYRLENRQLKERIRALEAKEEPR